MDAKFSGPVSTTTTDPFGIYCSGNYGFNLSYLTAPAITGAVSYDKLERLSVSVWYDESRVSVLWIGLIWL